MSGKLSERKEMQIRICRKKMEYRFEDILEIRNGKNQKAVENPEGRYPIYGSGGVIGYADDYICEADTIIIGRKGSINNPIYVSEPFWNVDTAFGLSVKKDFVLPKYLYYFCKKFDFGKLNKTVTIPSLTKSDLLKIKINVPVKEEQRAIIDKLMKIESIMAFRKIELDYLDVLIKARFVEMFGDPITNPKEWKMVELGKLTTIGSSKRIFEKEYVSEGIPFYRTKEIVELSKGNSISTELFITKERFFEIKDKYGVPKKGDLLVSAVGTIGVIWIVDGSNDFYFKDGNLIRVDASEKFDSVYMKNLLENLIDDYKKQMSTGTTYNALTISGLTKLKVYDVPIELQNLFSEFVNQVYKSKVTVQKALEETQILFDSLMQKYFG